jgi:hypothetical protein
MWAFVSSLLNSFVYFKRMNDEFQNTRAFLRYIVLVLYYDFFCVGVMYSGE